MKWLNPTTYSLACGCWRSQNASNHLCFRAFFLQNKSRFDFTLKAVPQTMSRLFRRHLEMSRSIFEFESDARAFDWKIINQWLSSNLSVTWIMTSPTPLRTSECEARSSWQAQVLSRGGKKLSRKDTSAVAVTAHLSYKDIYTFREKCENMT